MEILSLLIAFIDAVAWPTTVLIVLYHLRYPLLKLVPQLSQLKVGSFEFNLAERTDELAEDIEELTSHNDQLLAKQAGTSAVGTHEERDEITSDGDNVVVSSPENGIPPPEAKSRDVTPATTGVWARWDAINRAPITEFAERVAPIDPLAVYREGRRRLEALIRTVYDLKVQEDLWIGDVRPKLSRLVGEGVLSTLTAELIMRAIDLADEGRYMRPGIPPDVVEYSALSFARTVSSLISEIFRELEKANDWGGNSNAELGLRPYC